MPIKLNTKGKTKANTLINQGSVDKESSWSFSASDGNAILGDPPDYREYAKWFLGIDDSADKETKDAYKYPFGKDGKVYRSALIAIRQRAAQQDETEIYDAAGALIEKIDGDKKKADSECLRFRKAPAIMPKADGPASVDVATRSVEVVMATEDPVTVWDYERGLVQEVLLMSGMQMPPSNQFVMLDDHSRYGTGSILGSARDIRIDGDNALGRAYFSTAPEAESPWIKTKEGHLTDFSIGYRSLEATWIPEQTTQIIQGRTFAGPLLVTTKWQPRELSPTPIGADPNARARSQHYDVNITDKEDKDMNEKVRKLLESRGLPKEATEEEALAFLDTLDVRREPAEPNREQEDKIRAEATGKERDRIKEIDAMCARYECQDMARSFIVDGRTIDDARAAILDKLHADSRNPGFRGVQIITEEKDKFRAACQDGLMLRAGMQVANPAPGADNFRGYSLAEMARECLRMAGMNHHGNVKEMVGRALTSSDFPNILANLATKSMQQAWEGSVETWQIWCGIGSVADFKTYYDNALSEHDDLEEVPDSGEIKFGSFSEKTPETYKAASYAKKFRITRVMIINDDMGALTAMPARRAEAAARKVGDVAYAVLTANGNMGDGHAIFDNTNHANDAASGYRGVPGIVSIGEGVRAMGTQKDIKGLRRLNINPAFFLAPKALQGSSEIFFSSDKFSDHSTVATDSSFASTRNNPYAGNYFTRVYEPRLDDNSVYYWYLAGPKGRTVKVVFLNGIQAPTMEMRQPGFTIEGFEYLVAIDVGAYATDYRALYRNQGA